MRIRQLILPVTAVALITGIAIHQQRTLAGLKEQSRSLEESLAKPQPTPSFTLPPAGATPLLNPEQSAALFPEAEAASLAVIRVGGWSPELHERLFLATRSMDVASLVRLIAILKELPDLPAEQRKDFEIHFAYLLAHEQPEKAFAILLNLPKVAADGKLLCVPFRQWMAKDPAAAAEWFERQLGAGHAVTNSPELRRAAIEALFRANPDRGLNLALSLLPAVPDTKEINHLAVQTAVSLADEREHASYLAALRRVAEKSPGNPVLEQIRAAYLNELPARLKVWAFDDVTPLLDGELTTEEKRVTARNLSTFSDLDAPDRWADWFAKIGGELDGEHPLRNYLRSWSFADYRAVGQWLDHHPDGATKNELVFEHADRIRDSFPDEAARRALALPASLRREELLKAIHASWQAKDPAAAESFARGNGLAE